jgi:hypothetical protein
MYHHFCYICFLTFSHKVVKIIQTYSFHENHPNIFLFAKIFRFFLFSPGTYQNFDFNADPDPAFHSNPDPDTAFKNKRFMCIRISNPGYAAPSTQRHRKYVHGIVFAFGERLGYGKSTEFHEMVYIVHF